VKSDIRSTDNGAATTRVRVRVSEGRRSGMTVGPYWELCLNSSPASRARPDADTDADRGVTIRQANVWFSGNWGKLTLGHASEASDGTTGADLSGTNLTHSRAGSTDNSAGIGLQLSDGPGSISRGSTYSKYDGGRRDVIRYDSPKLGPVGIAASVNNDQGWSASAKVKTGLGGGQLSAALGYTHDTGGRSIESIWGMSASYSFSQGTSISGHYADRETEGGADSDSFSISLGHKWGVHAVQATYSEGNDHATGIMNSESTGYAIEYVHNLKKVNTQLYAGYLHAELDATGLSYEDIDVFTVGARVKFD